MKIASAFLPLLFIAFVKCQNSNPRWTDPIDRVNDECAFEMRKSVLERHNYYRSLHGLQPFETDSNLERAAQSFAQNQADNKKYIDWSHKNSSNENQYISNLGNPYLPTLKYCW